MSHKSKITDESGIALITSLLVLMLVSALMAGIFAAVQSDLREAATDRDQTQAYAAAHAGLEQLTAGLAELFMQDVSPEVAEINAVAANPPAIAGFQYLSPGGGDGFTIDYVDTNPADGTPDILPNTAITTGPFTGFIGLITPYTMTVTARSNSGNSEVRLRRGLQTVAVPVFQFGMFSETDLSVFAGGGFRFGGRVHTNGSLFVAAQSNGDPNIRVTFNDRVTAVNEIIRRFLSNGRDNSGTAPAFNNQVLMPRSTSATLVMTPASPNMGSVVGMPGSAVNTNWMDYSTGGAYFNGFVLNGRTGARRLELPLVSQGAQPIDLIRRPLRNSNEHVAAPLVFAQRFYAQASLRILLSDRIQDFQGLPTITAGDPVRLDADTGAANNWTVAPPTGYGPVDATRPPIARSIGPAFTTTHATVGGAYAAPFTQVYVPNTATAIPPVYKLPQLSIFSNTGVLQQVVTCQGKTGEQAVAAVGANPGLPPRSFLACNVPSDIPVNSTVRAMIDGRQAIGFLTSSISAGASRTLTVGLNETARFSPNLIWMNHPTATVAGAAVPVTCEGYTDVPITNGGSTFRRFLNCRGLTAAPATNSPITTSALQAQNTGTIGGYIKVEMQDNGGNWTDVTMEILNLGIGDRNSGGTDCGDPTPSAILRIQRLRDNAGGDCTYAASQNSWDWWPQALYDAREGSFRDTFTAGGVFTQNSPMRMMGVMQYIALDVLNLKRWLAGDIGSSGGNARNDNNNGFIVYFSDRRGNHDPANGDEETGEYGFEDFINSTTAAGLTDGVLQAGEDVNVGDPRYPANSQQTYGGIPWNNAANIPTAPVPAVAGSLYTFALARPATVIPFANTATLPGAGQARVNKTLLFRRALKLVRGGIGIANVGVNSLPDAGLTVAAENPVYVHGNYNANSTAPVANWTNMEPNRPAAIIADAITLLSNSWSDARSFEAPNVMPSRVASATGFRFAAIAGKGLSFPYCGGACGNPGDLFGTDGGAANFFRLLENWAAPAAIRYRGSIVSLHVNRQAVGAYKFAPNNNHHYNGGPRDFTFDADFLIPAELPPGTPMFRDINTLQFRQILRPNQP